MNDSKRKWLSFSPVKFYSEDICCYWKTAYHVFNDFYFPTQFLYLYYFQGFYNKEKI